MSFKNWFKKPVPSGAGYWEDLNWLDEVRAADQRKRDGEYLAKCLAKELMDGPENALVEK